MVMSMSSALRSAEAEGQELPDIESIIQGNLCRCTGYRPIIEGFRTFCRKQIKNGVCKDTPVTFDKSTFAPYSPSCDPVFPEELCQLPKRSLVLSSDEGPNWVRPASMEELKCIFANSERVKLVAGGTGKYKVIQDQPDEFYDMLVQVTDITELAGMVESEKGITFGSATPMGTFSTLLKDIVQRLPPESSKIFKVLLDILSDWVCPQISNVATIGGHLGWAHPSSDLIPVLMATNCECNLINLVTGDKSVKKVGTALLANYGDLITGIFVPFSKQSDTCLYYKKALRKEMNLSVANAAFFCSVTSKGKMESLKVTAGGTESTHVDIKSSFPVLLVEVASLIIENYPATIDQQELSQKIMEELPVKPDSPGELSRFRKCLVAHFVGNFLRGIKSGIESGYPREKKVHMESHHLFRKGSPGSLTTNPVHQPVPHRWGAVQATGEARYVCDMTKYQDELVVIPLHSDWPHSIIENIDYSEALAAPGVVGTLTPADIKDNWWGLIFHDEQVIATENVFSGQVIGALVCSSYDKGQRAIKLVKVSSKQKPHNLYFEDATESIGPDCVIEREGLVKTQGDEIIVKGKVKIGGQKHMYFERQEAVAIPSGEKDEILVWVGTQNPSGVQGAISKVLQIPRHKIVVKCKRVGGGFGAKERAFVPLLATVAARKFNKPCRIVLGADEDAAITGHRQGWIMNYAATADCTGKISEIKIDGISNSGASLDLSLPISLNSLRGLDGGYTWDNFSGKIKNMKTNSVPSTAFRGFGRPEGSYVSEVIVEHVAYALGNKVKNVKEANISKADDQLHYGDMIVMGCTLDQCWELMLKISQFNKRSEQIDAFNQKSQIIKRGITVIPMKFPIGIERKELNQGHAYIQIYTDGTVSLSHGGVEMGQGLHTKMIQVCSETLGISIDKVHISDTGTDSVANSTPTVASIGSDVNGPAVIDACNKINTRMAPIKKARPEATWEEWVLMAYEEKIHLSAAGHYANHDVTMDISGNSGRLCSYFTFGAGCIEVEVNCHTGDITVLRADLVLDLGKSLNPGIDIGQIEGAFMQGLGYVTTERLLQSPLTGRFFTTGLDTYLIPTATDLPRTFNVILLDHPDDADRPTSACYSSKAVGEPPLLLAMGVPQAVRMALTSYRADHGVVGWFNLDIPLTCDKVRMVASDDMTRMAIDTTGEVEKQNKMANEV